MGKFEDVAPAEVFANKSGQLPREFKIGELDDVAPAEVTAKKSGQLPGEFHCCDTRDDIEALQKFLEVSGSLFVEVPEDVLKGPWVTVLASKVLVDAGARWGRPLWWPPSTS